LSTPLTIFARALLEWSAQHDVRLHFITPGKPTENANIESLNARIRDEFLNEHAFLTLTAARRYEAKR
jgi:putative transposase